MTSVLTDLGVSTGVSLIFLAISWSFTRAVNSGRPFSPLQKRMLLYSFVFVLGMSYLMLLVSDMRWPTNLIFPMIGAWGGLVALAAWWRYRRARTEPGTPRRPISAVLSEVIPALSLIICLIAAAVEWESIFEGHGRWWAGLLWLAGVAVSILAARQNRRTTVIVVLRGVVALLVIAVIAQRTSPALIAAAISGLVLLLVEKLWRRNPSDRGVWFHESTK
jgi:hypothetical protein